MIKETRYDRIYVFMKRIVGLIPLYDDEKQSYWMLPGYMKALELCGALPIMLPLTDNEEELDAAYGICDGILLTGGHDVSSAMYGEKPGEHMGATCSLRDQMESYLFGKALEEDKPVLGICRGIQFMNAFLGGTLYQDLDTEYDSKIEHHMAPPYDRPAHKVTVMENTMLADIIGAGEHEVNSYHHQAVKKVSDKVTVLAVSEDSLVEAISVDGKRFIVGIQWHPEFSYEKDENSRKIVQAFVDSMYE